jgi:hypothetical protein
MRLWVVAASHPCYAVEAAPLAALRTSEGRASPDHLVGVVRVATPGHPFSSGSGVGRRPTTLT